MRGRRGPNCVPRRTRLRREKGKAAGTLNPALTPSAISSVLRSALCWHRVLKPSGRFVFNVWDRISENEFADTVTEALAALFPHAPPRFLARTPHGYHDMERIRADLSAARFATISVDTLQGISKASSPLDPAIAYCQGTPLRNEIQAAGTSCLEDATKRAAEALADRFGTGEIEGRIRAFVITAIR